MTEHDAFQMAIIWNVTDLGPWRIYADWLEENTSDHYVAAGLRLVACAAASGTILPNRAGRFPAEILVRADVARLAMGQVLGSEDVGLLTQAKCVRLLAGRNQPGGEVPTSRRMLRQVEAELLALTLRTGDLSAATLMLEAQQMGFQAKTLCLWAQAARITIAACRVLAAEVSIR